MSLEKRTKKNDREIMKTKEDERIKVEKTKREREREMDS